MKYNLLKIDVIGNTVRVMTKSTKKLPKYDLRLVGKDSWNDR